MLMNEETLRKSSLNEIGRNPFREPEGYFSAFPSKLQARISVQKPRSVFERIYFYLKPQIVVVSTMISIYAVVYFGFSTYRDSSLMRNSLSKEIQEMNAMEQSGIDEAVIINYMVSDSIRHTAQQLKSDEIIDYLVSSGIEYETIVEEL
jgi:hypothetical protein